MLHAPRRGRQGQLRAGQRAQPVPRDVVPDAALAQLALTLASLDRPTLAGEVLDILGPRGQGRAGRRGAEAAQVLGRTRARRVGPGDRRDDGAGRPGVRPGPAAVRRPRGRRRLAPGPPKGRGLGPAPGQGGGGRRAGGVLRPGGPGRGPLPAGRHRQRRRGLSGRGPSARPRQGSRSSSLARRSGLGRRESGPVPHRGARDVRLLGGLDRVRPRPRPPSRRPRRQAVHDPVERSYLPADPELDGKPPADRLLGRDQPDGPSPTRSRRSAGGAGRRSGSSRGPRRRPAVAEPRVPRGRGDLARRRDPDRRVGADVRQLVHPGRQRAHLLLRPRRGRTGPDLSTSWPATCPAYKVPDSRDQGSRGLRPGPRAPRRGRRAEGPGPRREVDRPLQGHARRAVRPRQGPVPGAGQLAEAAGSAGGADRPATP